MMLEKLHMEVSHVFRYRGYTKKQKAIQWSLYMLRNLADVLKGIIGLLSFGILQTYWSLDLSEIILRNQIKFHKEKNEKQISQNPRQ
jgi:hypothetical protein